MSTYTIEVRNLEAFEGRNLDNYCLGPFESYRETVKAWTNSEMFVDEWCIFFRNGHPQDDGEAIAEIVEGDDD